MFDLINIFDVFLPQLLLYPNPSDPLNSEAASLLLKNPEKYKEKVREYVSKFAIKEKEDDLKKIDGEEEEEECSELSNAEFDEENDDDD